MRANHGDLPNSTTTTIALRRLKAIRNVVPDPPASLVARQPTATRGPRRVRRGLLAAAVALGAAVVGGGAVAVLSSTPSTGAVYAAEDVELRRVQVASAHHALAGDVVLPATLRPYQTTEIFARTSGYLEAWHVDIGDHVAAGQLLAEIDTPELDQELLQSEASLAQVEASVAEATAEYEESKQQLQLAQANIDRAKAQLELADITNERNKPLAKKAAISQQELDESEATVHSRQAEVTAAEAEYRRQSANLGTRQAIIRSREATVANAKANVQRLRELQGFQRIVAPFAGVITRRQAEVGMLVTAGTQNQTALYSLVQQDKLRVHIAVPQSQASQIARGQSVALVVPEHPGESFTGTITRTAASVDSRSRTLQVEIEMPNDDQRLLPGAYAEVRLSSSDFEKKLRVPASVLLLKSSGTFVATIDQESSIRLIPIQLGRDHGSEVEVVSGLTGKEALVLNPPDDLSSGERVKVGAASAG